MSPNAVQSAVANDEAKWLFMIEGVERSAAVGL